MGLRRRKEEITLFLGNGSSLKGDMHFSGTARIDGAFQGDIRGEGTLMVGPTAAIEGDIRVGSVVISGAVVGNVLANERLEIRAPGKVTGDISAPLVVIDEGVVFVGHCRMADDQQESPKVTLLATKS